MSLAGIKGQEEHQYHNSESPYNNNTSGNTTSLISSGGTDRPYITNRQPVRAGLLVLQAFNKDTKGVISPQIVLKEWTNKLVSLFGLEYYLL
jgi:hypothetical protein